MIVGLVLGVLVAPALGLGHSAPAGRAARRAVPKGFVGVMIDGPLLHRGVNLNGQLARMASDGVQAVRVEFNWSEGQPYPSWRYLPLAYWSFFREASGLKPPKHPGVPSGVPTLFLGTDRIVSLAARHHLTILPVIIDAPSWDASPKGDHLQPLHDAPYGAYVAALVHRYGPHGRFWSTHRSIPRDPITSWQIWDEPNLRYFWNTPVWGPSYVALLRVAHRAIKRADPHAQVVLASLTGAAYREIPAVYAVHGARRLFDTVAENIYVPTPGDVISNLAALRRVMDSHGDRSKPLLATELGWPSALGKTIATLGVATTEQGQAEKLSQLMPLLSADRQELGLKAFFYYTWASVDRRGAYSPFTFAGLVRYDANDNSFHPKPALAVFRRDALKMEGRR
jgi:hypothetical protein